MKRIILFIVSVVLPMALSAQDRANIVCGPYVQCVTETGFTVVWTTDIDAIGWVETAPDDGTHFYNVERTRHYDLRGYGRHYVGKVHKVRIEGLAPGEVCRYRLMSKGLIPGTYSPKYTEVSGSNVYRGQPYRASAFKDSYETVRFDVYNDVHGRDSVFALLLGNMRKNLDFVVFNGDMVSSIETEETMPELYLKTASRNLSGLVPLVTVRGNHELRGNAALQWFDYFATPTGQSYYAFSLGKFFFIVLDACEDKPDSDLEYSGIMLSQPYRDAEKAWLEQTLSSEEFKSAEKKIAFCHIPPETGNWFGNMAVCRDFVPLLNEAGIDLMLSGHIHRTRYDAPDSGISNAEFPVLCLPNARRTEVTADADGIVLKIFDSDNKLEKEFSL